jgi:hypothetical protein
MRTKVLGAIAAVLSLLSCVPASAFHDGGVANCQGCHTMHVSQDGRPGFHWTSGGNPNLLMYGNATDTCVRCHYFRGQISNGDGRGPGGDFYWLTRTFSWTTPWGTTEVSPGASHGHNVANRVFGIPVDPVLTTAPGGEFLSAQLGCTSCHDPHGNQNFRMLYDSTMGPAYDGETRFTFTADAPVATGNAGTTLVGGGGDESDIRHTVYKSGVSEWCANCHPALHETSGARFIHPSNAMLTAPIADNYNGYVSSDDPNGGDPATSYLGLVPFEQVSVDLETVDPANATEGPSGSDRVMCLTCHRAHASPFADAGRWDFTATFLEADSHPRTGDGGASARDVINRYYGRTFTPNQRSLCNKCHAKDFDDAPRVP